MNRYKPHGWRNESHRHALAARGITTNRYFATPSKKSLSMTQFLDEVSNRSENIKNDKCTICGAPAKEFRDTTSEREYSISGMCQKCQDGVFMAHKRTYNASKGLLDNVHEDEMAKSIRQRDIDVLQNEIVGDLSQAVDNGELTGANRERFMREIFANEAKLYMDGAIDKEDFESTVKRKAGHFRRVEARPHPGQFSFTNGVKKDE